MSNKKTEDKLRDRIRMLVQNRNRSCSASRFDTSDIIQLTEYQLWRDGVDSLESEYSDVDQALLATISKGNLAKALRDHRRKKRDAASDSPLSAPVRGNEPDPCEVAEAREIAEEIYSIIREMEEIDQQIYFMRFHCDAPMKEIEKEVGLTRRQLDTRFSNLKKHVRKCLESRN